MSPFSDMCTMSALSDLRDRVPGASFGVIKTIVSALVGGRMIIDISENGIVMIEFP